MLVIAVTGVFLIMNALYSFLSLDDPRGADTLVVEGWVGDAELEQVLDVYRSGGYERIIATGIPLLHGSRILPYENYAEMTRMRLLADGLPPARVAAVCAPDPRRNRTRAMARALRDFLAAEEAHTAAVDVFSVGVHARRSRDVYRGVLAPDCEVGVIAAAPLSYTESDWWRCSEGVKSVLSETFAYVYNTAFNLTDSKMNTTVVYMLAAVIGYLLGSVPSGLIIGKARGIDVRRHGSGNIGATNVFRTVGRNWGILALTLDFLKGLVAAYFVPMLLARVFAAEGPYLIGLVCGCAAIIGHSYSAYLKLRGGKGIATSAGMLAGVAAIPFFCGIAVWALFFLALRYVSLASMVAAAVVALTGWIHNPGGGVTLPIVLTGVAVLVIMRHRSNLRRLLAGTEHKVRFGGRGGDE